MKPKRSEKQIPVSIQFFYVLWGEIKIKGKRETRREEGGGRRDDAHQGFQE
jgi:hypothetical protein